MSIPVVGSFLEFFNVHITMRQDRVVDFQSLVTLASISCASELSCELFCACVGTYFNISITDVFNGKRGNLPWPSLALANFL